MPGQVDRCVCANVTFATMKAHVEASGRGGDVQSLRARFNCGAGCALCVPYVRAMLATGRTVFAVNDDALRQSAPPTPPLPPV
jgi:NAD(P)H-nitrite reductase large subunit